MHDANLWGRTAIGQYCDADKLSPYTLVGNAAYPYRPWMLKPFKGHKDGFTREEYHWNFVQSSTHMCVEWAFGMLKRRWKLLLKIVDVHLKNVHDLVSKCLILHNMCTIFGDIFWREEWILRGHWWSARRTRHCKSSGCIYTWANDYCKFDISQLGWHWRPITWNSKVHKARRRNDISNCNKHCQRIIQRVVRKTK